MVARARERAKPEVFTVKLETLGEGGVVDTTLTGATSSGMLRIVVFPDESFEYQLTVYNDAHAQFTSAYLYRAPATAGNVKAVLFTGELLTGSYIQLRGNGLFPPGIDRHAVLAELRENPGSFLFRVESRGKPLTGAIQPITR